ncbi:MAG: hypothetical protein AB8H86_32855 [Polyangiales bacterium]
MAVDIWILEVVDPQRAVRGLMKLFGLPHAQCQTLISSVPCRVKRDVADKDVRRYEDKLKSIGATVSWGPAGESIPPAPRVVVPPNEPPDELVEIPEVPAPFDASKTRLYWALGGVGLLGVLILAVAAPGLASGEAGWLTLVLGSAALVLLAVGVFGSVLSTFRLAMSSPVLPLAAAALAIGACALVLFSSEPDPEERLSHVRALRAEILGGQVPEARTFLSGSGSLAGVDAAASRAFVESLYGSGARRVFLLDEDGDGEAEWVAIDMPVLPARRSAIGGALRAFAGEDFSEIPAELATPSLARHWILPVDIHE